MMLEIFEVVFGSNGFHILLPIQLTLSLTQRFSDKSTFNPLPGIDAKNSFFFRLNSSIQLRCFRSEVCRLTSWHQISVTFQK